MRKRTLSFRRSGMQLLFTYGLCGELKTGRRHTYEPNACFECPRNNTNTVLCMMMLACGNNPSRWNVANGLAFSFCFVVPSRMSLSFSSKAQNPFRVTVTTRSWAPPAVGSGFLLRLEKSYSELYCRWMHPVAYYQISKYRQPSFATALLRALLYMYITTCFG
jgi:hypothetical protein